VSSLIGKETNEHRTSNVERPTSNTEQSDLRFKMVRLIGLKLDKAQRHPYWTFRVGRSMFDVQFVHCSGRV
jgi:hypothetical protein